MCECVCANVCTNVCVRVCVRVCVCVYGNIIVVKYSNLNDTVCQCQPMLHVSSPERD